MFKNSVPSGVTTTSGGEREKQGNVSSKTVLSGPEEEGTYNRSSCFAVHSKMSQSTNAKSKPVEGCILTLTQTIGLRSLKMSPSGCQVKLVP